MPEMMKYSLEDKLILIQSRLDARLWQHWRIELYSRDVLSKEKPIAALGIEDSSLTTREQHGRSIPILRIKGKVCFSPPEEGAIHLARFLDESENCLFQCDVVPSNAHRLDSCIMMHPANIAKTGVPLVLEEMSISVEAIIIPDSWGA